MKTIEDSDYEVVDSQKKCYEKLPEKWFLGCKRCGERFGGILAGRCRTGKTLPGNKRPQLLAGVRIMMPGRKERRRSLVYVGIFSYN